MAGPGGVGTGTQQVGGGGVSGGYGTSSGGVSVARSGPPPKPYDPNSPGAVIQAGDLRRKADAAAQKYGIDPALFERLVQQESGWDPNAVSSAGARGLTQLMPETAQALGVNPLNPDEALDGGARFLASLMSRYGGDKTKAVAAYNAGPGAVDRYGGVPPYAETQAYVQAVLGDSATGGGVSGALPADWASAYTLPDGSVDTHALGQALIQSAASSSSDPDIVLENVTAATSAAAALDKLNGDGIQTADGVVKSADLRSSDPAIRAQAQAALYAYGEQAYGQGGGNFLLTANGLPAVQTPAAQQAVADRQDKAAQQSFENDMARYKAKLTYDQVAQQNAAAGVSRKISGLAESRNRSQLIADTLLKAAPTATGGKTRFSGTDLGGATAGILRLAGVRDPGSFPLLNYPTSLTIDPAATMAQQDQALGVAGALPAIPQMTAQASEIPGAPPITAAANQQFGVVVQPPPATVSQNSAPLLLSPAAVPPRATGLVEQPGQMGAY